MIFNSEGWGYSCETAVGFLICGKTALLENILHNKIVT